MSKTSSSLTQSMVVIRKELRDWSRDRRSIITVLCAAVPRKKFLHSTSGV